MAEQMLIEVSYALPQQQWLLALELPQGATVADAVTAAIAEDDFPTLDPSAHKTGIFGRLASPTTLLQAGDRVEIYRPLLIDPKQARRRRAKRATEPRA